LPPISSTTNNATGNKETYLPLWNTFCQNNNLPSLPTLNTSIHSRKADTPPHKYKALIANLRGIGGKRQSHESSHEITQGNIPIMMPSLLNSATTSSSSSSPSLNNINLSHKNSYDYYDLLATNKKVPFRDEGYHIHDFIPPKTEIVDSIPPVTLTIENINSEKQSQMRHKDINSANIKELTKAGEIVEERQIYDIYSSPPDFRSTFSLEWLPTGYEPSFFFAKNTQNIVGMTPPQLQRGSMSPITLNTISSITPEKQQPPPPNKDIETDILKGVMNDSGIFEQGHTYDIYPSSPHFKSSLDLLQVNDESQFFYHENMDDALELSHY